MLPGPVSKHTLLMAVVLATVFTGCGGKKRYPTVPGTVRGASVPAPVGWSETGIASWYGVPYHGRASASGEIYDMEKLTAAHRTLPFQTWVRVDPGNGKTVEVRITDRGPFIDGRIIDLSHAAARAIGMIGPGTAKVRIEVIRSPVPETPDEGRFAVQAGAFRDRDNAERVRREMESSYGTARLVLRDGDPPLWRVLVGAETDERAADALAERIRAAGEQHRTAFVVRLDL
ncbi:MAG TPA: septal ring lytic transglycosylase RlpA family protein [Bryobacteraceae bacterium]|nr:septal ring lytic transglycosylase RlpA family protein [Bryobacteraceae bacterium]